MEEQVLHLPGGRHSPALRPLAEEEMPKLSQAGLCHLPPVSTCSENHCHEELSHPREGGPEHMLEPSCPGWHLTLAHQLCNQGNLTNLSVPVSSAIK